LVIHYQTKSLYSRAGLIIGHQTLAVNRTTSFSSDLA